MAGSKQAGGNALAHLKTHHGFERLRLRGLSGARDEFQYSGRRPDWRSRESRQWTPGGASPNQRFRSERSHHSTGQVLTLAMQRIHAIGALIDTPLAPVPAGWRQSAAPRFRRPHLQTPPVALMLSQASASAVNVSKSKCVMPMSGDGKAPESCRSALILRKASFTPPPTKR